MSRSCGARCEAKLTKLAGANGLIGALEPAGGTNNVPAIWLIGAKKLTLLDGENAVRQL